VIGCEVRVKGDFKKKRCGNGGQERTPSRSGSLKYRRTRAWNSVAMGGLTAGKNLQSEEENISSLFGVIQKLLGEKVKMIAYGGGGDVVRRSQSHGGVRRNSTANYGTVQDILRI